MCSINNYIIGTKCPIDIKQTAWKENFICQKSYFDLCPVPRVLAITPHKYEI